LWTRRPDENIGCARGRYYNTAFDVNSLPKPTPFPAEKQLTRNTAPTSASALGLAGLIALLLALALAGPAASPPNAGAQAGPTATASPRPTAAPQAPTPTAFEASYSEWLAGHVSRQTAAVQAVPVTLDLGNPTWRRDQALALDAWGSLIQEARDRRPPASAQTLHTTLLDALDRLDRARRLLLSAVASGQEPGPDLAAQLQAGRQTLDDVAERARALGEGQGSPAPLASVRGGDLRVTILAVTRPYLDRGSPLDPAWEYVMVRLRLENLGGEPITYDANQFRLRSVDETLHSPVPLGIPDELYYGALEGNRLASGVVGTLAYAVQRGVPTVALYYEKQPQDVALRIPLADLVPLATPAPSAAR